MKLFSLLLVAVSLAGVSCERHDFKETRQLQEHKPLAGAHGEHGAHEEAPHGEPAGH